MKLMAENAYFNAVQVLQYETDCQAVAHRRVFAISESPSPACDDHFHALAHLLMCSFIVDVLVCFMLLCLWLWLLTVAVAVPVRSSTICGCDVRNDEVITAG